MTTMKEVKELHSGKVEHSPVGKEMLGLLNKFHEIEEKNKCLRVQFLDWLSDKFLDWSNKCHVWSVKIDSPCVLKIEPRVKEQSNDAKDRKAIAQLKEDIERLTKQNNKLWEDRRKEFQAKAAVSNETAENVLKDDA